MCGKADSLDGARAASGKARATKGGGGGGHPARRAVAPVIQLYSTVRSSCFASVRHVALED